MIRQRVAGGGPDRLQIKQRATFMFCRIVDAPLDPCRINRQIKIKIDFIARDTKRGHGIKQAEKTNADIVLFGFTIRNT